MAEIKKEQDALFSTIYKMATDEKLNPMEAIVKKSEKNSLYEALDIAYIWLSRASAE